MLFLESGDGFKVCGKNDLARLGVESGCKGVDILLGKV